MTNQVVDITEQLLEREGFAVPGRFRYERFTEEFGYSTTGHRSFAGDLKDRVTLVVQDYGDEATITMTPESFLSVEYGALVDIQTGKQLESTRGREKRWDFGFKSGITGRAPINEINVEEINFGRFHYLNGYLEAALADYQRNDYLLGVLLGLSDLDPDELEIDSSRHNLNRMQQGRRDWQDALEQLLSGPEHQIKLKKSLIFLDERHKTVVEKMSMKFPKRI